MGTISPKRASLRWVYLTAYTFLPSDGRHIQAVCLDLATELRVRRKVASSSGAVREGDRDENKTNKLHGLSPRANNTDRATAASRRSDCQLLRIKGATWSA
jgi:hypothetical protein